MEIGFLRSLRPLDPPAGVSARLLLREGFVVAMRPDHPLAAMETVSLRALDHQPMVFYQREPSGGFTEQLLQMLNRAGATPLMAQEVREVSTLFGLVAAGIGITLIARSLCALQSAGLTYRTIIEPEATSEMSVLFPDSDLSIQAGHFLDTIAGPAPSGDAAASR